MFSWLWRKYTPIDITDSRLKAIEAVAQCLSESVKEDEKAEGEKFDKEMELKEELGAELPEGEVSETFKLRYQVKQLCYCVRSLTEVVRKIRKGED